jgi:hypothetical protein
MNPPPPLPLLPPGGAPPCHHADDLQGFYGASDDVLHGNYGPWAAAHAVDGINTPAAVREAMLNTSDAIPKAYLMLVPGPHGTPVIKMVYRTQLYRSVPGIPTPWDNQIYGFATDIGPGNQITTVEFPNNAFYLANEVRAPDIASMADAWAENPQADALGPFLPGDANTVLIRTRYLMIVPHPYVPLFLARQPTGRFLLGK